MGSRVKAWFLRRWPSIVSAMMLIVAFPPFNWWPFVFVAMVPLFYQLRTTDGKQAWKAGYLFGLIFFLSQLLWLFSLTVHWTHSQLLGLLPWILGSAYVAVFFGWVSVLVRYCFVRNWTWMIPVAWAGIEVVRSYVPVLAFPWGLAATPLYRSPTLIQTAHFGTIYLVSAWVILLNVCLTLFISPDSRSKARPMLAAVMVLFCVSALQYRQNPPTDIFPVTVAQPGVDMAFGNPETAPEEAARNVDIFTVSALKDGSKLMVLPEGTVHGTDYPPQPLFKLDEKLPLLFGGQHGKGPTYQTAFGYDGKWHFADKTRLVIMGEFVPGRATFPFIAKAFDLPERDLDASPNGIQSVEVGGITVGPMLCFEGLFPEVSYQQARNKSRMIAVMCIDDWYMGTAAPEQLKAAATFRAIETGLPLVRSASLGYSLVLDAHGNSLGELPLKQPKALTVDLHLPKESPLFPLLPVFPVAAVLVAVVLPWVRFGRRSGE